jgi:hypothetical protein
MNNPPLFSSLSPSRTVWINHQRPTHLRAPDWYVMAVDTAKLNRPQAKRQAVKRGDSGTKSEKHYLYPTSELSFIMGVETLQFGTIPQPASIGQSLIIIEINKTAESFVCPSPFVSFHATQ